MRVAIQATMPVWLDRLVAGLRQLRSCLCTLQHRRPVAPNIITHQWNLCSVALTLQLHQQWATSDFRAHHSAAWYSAVQVVKAATAYCTA